MVSGLKSTADFVDDNGFYALGVDDSQMIRRSCTSQAPNFFYVVLYLSRKEQY